MGVADGDSEGVSCIGWLGGFAKFQQARDHELDLLLGGETIANNSALDGKRGVLRNGEVAARGREHGDAANLA